ncbi:MAG: thioredoxin domain-containing protein [Micropruina sp.]|uniref:DsbA family protein n=1 Tax=Micropruina sp. TaxID=2737536 RepID=UPI0039E598A4
MSESRREALRRKQQAQAKAKRTQRIVIVGAIVLAIVVVGVFATIFFSQLNKGNTANAAAIPPNATSDRSGIVVNPGKAAQGAPKVELFFDYQCPICKQFEDAFGSTLDDMADQGQIELVYRTLTFMDGNLRNDSSSRAGIAAACADNAGKYSAYHNAVFAGQPATEGTGYTTQQLRADFAATAGITGDALTTFQSCYDSKATAAFVTGTNELAAKAGVTSTPTLRVNGTTIDNATIGKATTPDAFRQLILSTEGKD